VTLTNSGTAALTIGGISTTGDFRQTNSCGSSLSTGASCAIAITFVPTATGTRSGSLTITDNAAGSPQTVSLNGTGETAGTSSGGPGPTTSGSYQIGISGQSGTLVQSTSVTLNVQ